MEALQIGKLGLVGVTVYGCYKLVNSLIGFIDGKINTSIEKRN
jgi:hypothetical protein